MSGLKEKTLRNGRVRRDTARRGVALIMVCGTLFTVYFLNSCSNSGKSGNSKIEKVQEGSGIGNSNEDSDSETRKIKELTEQLEGSDALTKFSHDNEYHQRLTCLACHRRDDNSSKISFPGKAAHSPCIGCHTKQFENKQNLMCTICHTDAESGAMKKFPALKTFNARFDHAVHLGRSNCADCHRPVRNGAGKSIPVGAAVHNSCFQCHSFDKENKFASCSACHQQGLPGTPRRTPRRTTKGNFSHASHKMDCNSCHKIMKTGVRGRQVTSIAASMHFPPGNRVSCATCHNNRRAFGGDDFSDCRRCHTGRDFRF